MTTQRELAATFAHLHRADDPLLLVNVWDAGTARIIQDAGAKAIATSSASVARAHGAEDGEQLPFALVVANTARIVKAVQLPVTIDLETGYGQTNDDICQNVERILHAGAVGINIEDQILGNAHLRPIEEQCSRITAIRHMADQLGIPLFINMRTDVFLKTYPAQPTTAQLEEAIARGQAYANAGANGFFTPCLVKPDFIQTLCQTVALPINLMFLADTITIQQMGALGVARISYGAYPYQQMTQMLKHLLT
jgi:2-methylisocitrate lyase-like PEP mutase family enzyme